MTTAATSLLGLALPVTGELQGTWGDTVNNSITSLLDTAVAGTTTLSTDGDVTLTTTTLAANQARQAILLCSGARTALRTITAPAQSKIYTIINATTGGFSVKLVGVGPTTGLTIPNGASAVVAWNGSDFIEIGSSTVGNLTVNGNLTVTGTSTLTGAATLTANPTLSAGTANGVAYLNGSKVVTTGSALTFDGTNAVSMGSGGSSNTATSLTLNATDNAANGSYILGKRNGSSAWLIGDTASSLGSGSGFTSYNYGTAPWIWYLQTGGEQMRLTSTGLGIGTSSPGYKLTLNAFTAVSGPVVAVKQSAETSAFYGVAVQRSGNDSTIGLAFNSSADAWQISASYASTGGYKPITFATSDTERVRIDTSGNLLVGKTSANAGVVGAELRADGTVISTQTASTNSGDSYRLYSTGAGAYRFYVGLGGTVYATSTTISAISDIRYKENVRDLDVGLDAVMALKPRLYDWKEGKGANIKNARGFIAQEFEQVFPDLIDEWKDPAPEGEEPYKSVRQDLIPVLVKAIQEQQAIINQLKARLDAANL